MYKGQHIVTIESMKMESGVSSPCNGVVDEIMTSSGKTVEMDEVLITLKAG